MVTTLLEVATARRPSLGRNGAFEDKRRHFLVHQRKIMGNPRSNMLILALKYWKPTFLPQLGSSQPPAGHHFRFQMKPLS